MRGKCAVCGEEDNLVNKMCPKCLTMSMFIEGDLEEALDEDNDDDDEIDEDGVKVSSIVYEKHVNETRIDMEQFKELAMLGRKVAKTSQMVDEAGIDTNEMSIYKEDFNKLYNLYKSQIDSGMYKIVKANSDVGRDIINNKAKYEVIDTSRGLLVYEEVAVEK